MEKVLQRLRVDLPVEKKPPFHYPPPVVVKRKRTLPAKDDDQTAEEENEERRPCVNLRRRRAFALRKAVSIAAANGVLHSTQEVVPRQACLPIIPAPPCIPSHAATRGKKRARLQPVILHSEISQRVEGKDLQVPNAKERHEVRDSKCSTLGEGSERWQFMKGATAIVRPTKRPRCLHKVGRDRQDVTEVISAIRSVTLEDPVTKEKNTYPVYRDEEIFGKDAADLLYEDDEEEEFEGEDDLPTTKHQWKDGLKRSRKLAKEAAEFLWCLAEVNPSALAVERRLEKRRTETRA